MQLAEAILNQMKDLRKPRVKFMVILFKTALSLMGRVNFSQLSRYSSLNEKTYSRNFKRSFDFVHLNSLSIERVYNPKNDYFLAIDASFISKSGKATYGYGNFWNSIQNRSMKGLEISTIALVDKTYNTAYTLSVKQVPPSHDDSEENAIDFSVNHIKTLKQEHFTIALPRHIASDGFYAKRRFVNGALEAGFHTISKLRKDANLRYLYEPPKRQHKKRGRPRLYGNKINLDSIDLSKFSCHAIDERIRLYSGIVYSVSLKRKIHLVYVAHTDTKDKQSYALLFSTDVTLVARTIYCYYTARFQIEFVFRDAKQFTGLTHCQARCKESLDFHFNMSLSLLNLARIEHRMKYPTDNEGFSMASLKRSYTNELLLNLFLSKLELDPNNEKIQSVCQELRNYGSIAA